MSRQAYDQKNQEDYEEYSQALNNALLEIQNNNKLKATIAQLSKMTGIHRNTISGRVWPGQKLKQIKETRKVEAENIAGQEQRHSIDKQALLEEQLSQMRKEVVYWFNEYQDMKRFYEFSDKRFHQMRESRNHYKGAYEANKKSLLAAEQELERLRDLLELKGVE